jgi:hypothetical protein
MIDGNEMIGMSVIGGAIGVEVSGIGSGIVIGVEVGVDARRSK